MNRTLTEQIMELTAPWDNPYQGQDKKVVFVCSAGILRSATAARLYADKYNTRSAGSEEYALIPLSANLIVWANQIVFVNKENYESALKQFEGTDLYHNLTHHSVILNIPDNYEHMHPELIKAFEEQYEPIE